MYAVDTNGMERWRFEGAGNGVTSAAVDNDGNVYFASGTHLYSVGSNGSLRWDANGIDYGSDWEGGATIGRDGTLYVAGASVSAIDYSGRLKWKYDFVVGSPSTGCVPVTDVDGTIYVGRVQDRLQTATDTINFIALNPDGSVKFKMCLRSPDGRVPDIDSHPAIGSDGRIYVGSDKPYGRYLYKIR